MKNIYTLFLFVLIGAAAQSQCTQAVDNNTYTQNYSTIAAQGNDQLKLDQAIAFTAYNCVSSNQVKAIAMLFNSESFRFDFCVLSYNNVVDRYDFYEVYDAFQSFSYVFRLHDFVLEQRKLEENNSNNNGNDNQSDIAFPNWNYPNYQNANSTKGCPAPIPNTDFNTLSKSVNLYNSDSERMIAASVVAQEQCLSMSQFMKMASLFSLETKRKEFMMKNFQFVHDQEHYEFAKQCFAHEPYQVEWVNFCVVFLTPAAPIVTCDVDDKLFKEMLNRIESENFADDQLNVVKMLNKESCFSTAQVKKIMDVFSFPENKLDAAKILYPKCTDKKNYYQLKGSFSFPQYENEFQDMITKG